MAKIKQTPGTALTALLEKHNLNYNRLAKVIGLSSAMVRLIARDENPVSASVAFRFAKFFKTKPEYWLVLQMEFDRSRAAEDKKLAKALKDIPTVDKAAIGKKPRAAKSAKPAAKGKKSAAKAKGKAAASKKTASKKAAPKQKKAKAAPKKVAPKKAVSKPSAPVKKPQPAPVAKVTPPPRVEVVQPAPPAPPPTFTDEVKINEPQI